jgi:DNA-binding transcriptional ArsR family regulator
MDLISSELRKTAEAIRNGTGPSGVLHALLLDSGLTTGAISSATKLSPNAISPTLGLLTDAGVVVQQTSMADTLPRFSISGDPQE